MNVLQRGGRATLFLTLAILIVAAATGCVGPFGYGVGLEQAENGRWVPERWEARTQALASDAVQDRLCFGTLYFNDEYEKPLLDHYAICFWRDGRCMIWSEPQYEVDSTVGDRMGTDEGMVARYYLSGDSVQIDHLIYNEGAAAFRTIQLRFVGDNQLRLTFGQSDEGLYSPSDVIVAGDAYW